jgi:alpha-1,2-mannosyltransferase
LLREDPDCVRRGRDRVLPAVLDAAWSQPPNDRLDLDVYRTGGRVWLNGGHLYDALPATALGIRLPFTYPPFAAIVSSPLSLIPMGAAGLVVTLLTLTLLVVPLRIYLRRLAWRLGWVLPLALFLEPVRSTIQFGQVNVVLMTLVTADCLARAPRWPRGSLTGLAAAVKLTPLPFVLFFLLRRDYRAAAVMSLSFAACTGLGFLLAPGDSTRYWTSAVFDTVYRIGNPAYAPNQSIVGVLERAGLHQGTPAATPAWLALSAAVFTVACLGMRRAFAAADAHLALVLNAFASLLASPISWSHHWVWAGPAVLALAAASRDGRHRTAWLAAVSGMVIFIAAPQWWFDREPHWALWQQAAGSSYVLFAAAVLIMSTRMRSPGGNRSGGVTSRLSQGFRTRRSGRSGFSSARHAHPSGTARNRHRSGSGSPKVGTQPPPDPLAVGLIGRILVQQFLFCQGSGDVAGGGEDENGDVGQ